MLLDNGVELFLKAHQFWEAADVKNKCANAFVGIEKDRSGGDPVCFAYILRASPLAAGRLQALWHLVVACWLAGMLDLPP